MKKLFLSALVSVLLLTLCFSPALTEALPDIDDALSASRFTRNGRVQVLDGIASYTMANEEEFDFDGFQCIILERRSPEKAFTESPESWFDLPFFPEDAGEGALYLRADMMALLPAEMRASSLADADLLVIAEDEYSLDTQIIHTEYEETGADEIPDWVQTPEEMQEYLLAHPKVVKSRTFKPLQSVYSFVNIYSTKNGAWALFDYRYDDCPLECNNEAASDLWDRIAPLGDLLDLLALGAEYREETEAALDALSGEPEESVALWKSCVAAGEYETAAFSVEKAYWDLAAGFPALDDSEEAAEWYPKLLDARDREGLTVFVAFRNYSGIDTPDSVIIDDKLYMAQADPDWFDRTLTDCVTWLMEE